MRHRRGRLRPPALILAIGAVAAAPLLELHADNFDRVLSQYRFVLVHFWASFDEESQKFKRIHEEVARREEAISDIAHGRSDITDARGPTSYLTNWGVTRIPTIVLFRDGRARVYPHEGPSFNLPSADELAEWLASATDDANAAGWPRRENEELLFNDEDMEDDEVLRVAHARTLEASNAAMHADKGRPTWSDSAGEEEAADEGGRDDDFEPRSKPPSKRRLAAPAPESVQQGTNDRVQPQTPPANPKRDGKDNRLEKPAPRVGPVGRDGKPVSLEGLIPADGGDDEDDVDKEADEEHEPPPMSEEEVRAECGALLRVIGLTDASFSDVVLRDTTTDVVVLFYRPSAAFCAANGTAYAQLGERYADSSTGISVTRMDVQEHRSPFAFRAGELPVMMLFPARVKRPLEFSDDYSLESLDAFVKKYARNMQDPQAEVEEEPEIVSGFKDEV